MNNLRQQIVEALALFEIAKKHGMSPDSPIDAIMHLIAAHDTERTKALLAALPERKQLNPPAYGGPMVFDDDHDIKVGWNRCLAEVRQIIEKGGE